VLQRALVSFHILLDEEQANALMTAFRASNGFFDYTKFTTLLFPPVLNANMAGVGASVDSDAAVKHRADGGWARYVLLGDSCSPFKRFFCLKCAALISFILLPPLLARSFQLRARRG
jgi:hypothetical protein